MTDAEGGGLTVEVRMLALVARTALRCERLLLRHLIGANMDIKRGQVMEHNDEMIRFRALWEEAGR